VENGWIGGAPPDEPSLVVSVAHSALGVVHHFRIHVGRRTLLLHPSGAGWDRHPADGLDIAAHLAGRLDLAGRDEPAPVRWSGTLPAARYTALRRPGFTVTDPPGTTSSGSASYDARPDGSAAGGTTAGGTTVDDAAADGAATDAGRPIDAAADGVTAAGGAAAGTGWPVELVRALGGPVAVGRVEVVRRDGAGLAAGPRQVLTEELAWVDGGDDGLWTVRPGDADTVRIASATPAGIAAELAVLVRAAEGC
jgi:hypothetical protein